MTDLDRTLVTAHRRNIHRYKRLLRTHLTDLERSFVLRRMNEEKSALTDLLRKRPPRHAQPFGDHLPAATCSGAEANHIAGQM
jgi:hypothetical protein